MLHNKGRPIILIEINEDGKQNVSCYILMVDQLSWQKEMNEDVKQNVSRYILMVDQLSWSK